VCHGHDGPERTEQLTQHTGLCRRQTSGSEAIGSTGPFSSEPHIRVEVQFSFRGASTNDKVETIGATVEKLKELVGNKYAATYEVTIREIEPEFSFPDTKSHICHKAAMAHRDRLSSRRMD
jgi:hypothetical protein